jgi:hypothetical protein
MSLFSSNATRQTAKVQKRIFHALDILVNEDSFVVKERLLRQESEDSVLANADGDSVDRTVKSNFPASEKKDELLRMN